MRRLLPYVAVVLTFAAGLWQKWPCHSSGWRYEYPLIFGKGCYSDLPFLFTQRGLAEGRFPYATETSFEYPVITGYLADVTARLTASPSQFFLLNLMVMLIATLVTVWATIRLTGRWQAGLIVALSPVLALTGAINWDMLAVMLVSLAMLAWAREKPALAGLAIGLGAAAKLYPVLLFFPLLLLTVHTGQRRRLVRATAAAAVGWLLVNLPVLVLFPQGWAMFWRFNADRGADFGSIFYALGVTADLNFLSPLLLILLLVAIALWAPRRLEVLTLLTVTAFLITNKVYSPQYVLWLLPLVVVAGTPLTVIVVWQMAEIAYWWAIWSHLMGTVTKQTYAWLVGIRIAAEILAALGAVPGRKPDDADPARLPQLRPRAVWRHSQPSR